MKIIYNTGQVAILSHKGMTFTIYNITLNKPDVEIIGTYINSIHMIKRITKSSEYGKMVMRTLIPPEESLSQDQSALRKLISTITSNLDINKERKSQ